MLISRSEGGLIRLPVLLETISEIQRSPPPGPEVAFSVTSCGLFDASVAREFKAGGVQYVTFSLNAHDERTWGDVMQPQIDKSGRCRSFQDVCRFIDAAVTCGLEVECTAVHAPHVQLMKVRELAVSLGVKAFKTTPFFPAANSSEL